MKRRTTFPVQALRLGFLAVAAAGLALASMRAIALVYAPYELDYGEGIIAWQARQLESLSRAYRPLATYPFLVFHYPPIYHYAMRLAGHLTGDFILAGRWISAASALLIAVLFGTMVVRVLPSRLSPWSRMLGAVFAASAALGLDSMRWVPAARVDLLGLLLTFSGIWLLACGPFRLSVHLIAFAFFVAALYTKQTLLAAPLAGLLLLLIVRPRRALAMAAWCVGLGGGIFWGLYYVTGGEVLRHLLLYNRNPFSWRFALEALGGNLHEVLLLALGTSAATAALVARARPPVPGFVHRLRGLILISRRRRAIALCGLHLGLALVIALSAGKEGSNYNYFLEWNLAACPVSGILLASAVKACARRKRMSSATIAVILAAAVVLGDQTFSLLRRANEAVGRSAAARGELAWKRQTESCLSDFVRRTPGEIVSEQMTVLVRQGRVVPFEPAIIKVLGQTGAWDEGPALQMLRGKRFTALLLLRDTRRFTPRMLDAIHASYKPAETCGGGQWILYRPRPGSSRLD